MQKTLNVPYIADLDFLNTDAIFNRLESSGVRHNIGELNWKEQYPYHPLTTFTIAHSANYIYVNFFVRCNYLRAMNFENNSPVYEDSCVMFFVQPEGSKGYWRITQHGRHSFERFRYSFDRSSPLVRTPAVP